MGQGYHRKVDKSMFERYNFWGQYVSVGADRAVAASENVFGEGSRIEAPSGRGARAVKKQRARDAENMSSSRDLSAIDCLAHQQTMV